MTTPARRWISSPGRWLIAVACLIVAAAGAATYRYACARITAIAYVESTGGHVKFLPRPDWCPKWVPVPKWLQSVNDVWVKGPIDFDCRRIEPLRELRTLATTSNDIDDEVYRRICRFPRIRRIYVDSDRVTDAGLDGVRACRHLEELQLPNASITDNGLRSLAGSQLCALYASGSPITDEGLRHLAGLPLRHLVLILHLKGNLWAS